MSLKRMIEWQWNIIFLQKNSYFLILFCIPFFARISVQLKENQKRKRNVDSQKNCFFIYNKRFSISLFWIFPFISWVLILFYFDFFSLISICSMENFPFLQINDELTRKEKCNYSLGLCKLGILISDVKLASLMVGL